jgi:hypothetical protein
VSRILASWLVVCVCFCFGGLLWWALGFCEACLGLVRFRGPDIVGELGDGCMYVREKTALGRKCRTRLGFEFGGWSRLGLHSFESRSLHHVTSFEMGTKGLGSALDCVGSDIMGA